MRLVTYMASGKTAVGALTDDGSIVDLARASGGAALFSSMLSLIESGDEGLSRVHAILARPPLDAIVSWDSVRLLAPIPRPPRMRATSMDPRHLIQAAKGMAYLATRDVNEPDAAFAAAVASLPSQPGPAYFETPVYWFMDNYCVSGPEDQVVWPGYSDWIDYELEIAAVIGKAGKDVSKKEAANHIFGYTILNDLSARDAQSKASATGLTITAKGKDFEGSYPMGPCIVTADEICHRDMQATLTVNGEVWAEGTPRDAHWGFDDAIAYASQSACLIPGEVLTSATVANCCGAEQRRRGARGDRVELSVEGIGTLRTFII